MMNTLVNERKFTAHGLDVDRALALIAHHCHPHRAYPFGRISSIYFDTPLLSTFREKIEGDTLKRKYRIRWYEGTQAADDSTIQAFLEIKYRYGSARDKLRHPFKVNAEWIRSTPLTDGGLVDLLYREAACCEDNIPINLFPLVSISYDRHRYECPYTGDTVCVDCNIRMTRLNADRLPQVEPFDLNTVICEHKRAGFGTLPWARILYHAGFRIRSFSKYGECINQVLHGGAPTVIRMSI